jgi:hypothetical protein
MVRGPASLDAGAGLQAEVGLGEDRDQLHAMAGEFRRRALLAVDDGKTPSDRAVALLGEAGRRLHRRPAGGRDIADGEDLLSVRDMAAHELARMNPTMIPPMRRAPSRCRLACPDWKK